jgi:hypothetical protein
MSVYHGIRPFPIPADPYDPAPRTSTMTAARVERELAEEEGIDQAATYFLTEYRGDREFVVGLLRKWTQQTGNLRWGLVADHIEAMRLTDARD